MPVTIPTADNFSRVMPSGGGAVSSYDPNIVTRAQQNATSLTDQSAQNLAQANEQLAGTVSNDANQWAQIQKQKIDTTRVQDAVNQMNASDLDMTYGDKGYAQIKGANFVNADKPVIPDYIDRRKQAADQISSTLSPDQQRMFNAHAQQTGLEFQKGLLTHAIQQHDVYDQQTQLGTLQTAEDQAGANYSDPMAVFIAKANVNDTLSESEKNGRAPDLVASQKFTAISSINTKVIQSALENNDVTFAEKYLKDNADAMTPSVAAQYHNKITEYNKQNLSITVANNIAGRVVNTETPTDATQAFNVALNTESGGQQFDKTGAVITSAKGARGIAQIMPGTWDEARRLAGLPETASIDNPADNRAAGQAYFNKQLQDNAGDPQKAWAAYNAGPGALQTAIQAANKEGAPNNWLSHLPAETQAYVATNSAAMQKGSGIPAPMSLSQVDSAVAAVPEMQGQPPDVVYAAQQKARALITQQRTAVKDAQSDAMESLRSNVDNGTYSTWADVPVDVRQAIGPNWKPAMDYINGMGNDVAKNDPVAQTAYQNIIANPDAVIHSTPADIMAQTKVLGTENVNKILDYRASLLKDASKLESARALSLRIKTTAPAFGLDGSANKDTLNDVSMQIIDNLHNAEVQKGRKLTPVEVQPIINDAMKAKVIDNSTWYNPLSWGGTTKPAAVVTVADLPDAVKQKTQTWMAQKYQATNSPMYAPTDQNVARWGSALLPDANK